MNCKRTFIAVPVAETVCDQLRKIQHELPQIGRYAKFVRPENVHLTLKFLGDTTDEQIEHISHKLSENLSGSGAFDFACTGTGCFPNKRNPSVLWLGIEDPEQYLTRLSQTIEAVAAQEGFAPENRPFSPHITFARIKDRSNPYQPQLKEFLNYPEFRLNNRVRQVIFYESRLYSDGPVYNALKIITL